MLRDKKDCPEVSVCSAHEKQCVGRVTFFLLCCKYYINWFCLEIYKGICTKADEKSQENRKKTALESSGQTGCAAGKHQSTTGGNQCGAPVSHGEAGGVEQAGPAQAQNTLWRTQVLFCSWMQPIVRGSFDWGFLFDCCLFLF